MDSLPLTREQQIKFMQEAPKRRQERLKRLKNDPEVAAALRMHGRGKPLPVKGPRKGSDQDA